MALRLTLKPNERIVVNGCVIRNANRRQTLQIENTADVIRAEDLLDENCEPTPVKQAYFLIQTALIRADTRDTLVPVIQEKLADLATIFSAPVVGGVFEAANWVSQGDYYKALSALRPVMRREEELFARLSGDASPAVALEGEEC
ncbi:MULTISPECIES: flagellar biosynthesis repressor FlbT [Thioclava]|uniref:Flagellum biosynthesis protein FlbT n=1 Tax=Thioclava electrotropha TaxID=1549850 RepID=A0ABX6YQ60_9RHOB|nr:MULTISPECIES: flagellar biosynthesis repressor FlbT [Thioclava]OOY04410.1 flagellum biosynthesis protein FlbT [Thioclava sp. F28-4]OOY15245.1 flagellum biosynthesis protein FlbT [Thioclava sp. DLFJ4-1]OOY22207.1 flagellum biosynthesis protein FlbT [Thioclava sp. DLFJ5-1]OOY32440.1 flagellum biosynthesis protein FlbT [Thioclava sp. F36-6]QPZ89823.1 flagellum biosynthesis protein FlbT [Thioclava electrotropha]